MKSHTLHALAPWLCAVVLLGAGSVAQAGCSRVISTPMAATGQSVVIDGDTVSGIYPDILRANQTKETCLFTITPVPRARLELLFESGKADLLFPASKTPRRDELGVFVPLTYSRAALITVAKERAPIKTLKELVEARDIKVALVRGYDYGPAYTEMAAELTRQGRLLLESDPMGVARLLKNGIAQATVMGPTILVGTLNEDERVRELGNRLRYESVAELPWLGNGVYLSKTSLSEADRGALLEFFERIAKSGAVWKGFEQVYDSNVLKTGIKAR
jgi:polar amino acid transport system substrate-binding protein